MVPFLQIFLSSLTFQFVSLKKFQRIRETKYLPPKDCGISSSKNYKEKILSFSKNKKKNEKEEQNIQECYKR